MSQSTNLRIRLLGVAHRVRGVTEGRLRSGVDRAARRAPGARVPGRGAVRCTPAALAAPPRGVAPPRSRHPLLLPRPAGYVVARGALRRARAPARALG